MVVILDKWLLPFNMCELHALENKSLYRPDCTQQAQQNLLQKTVSSMGGARLTLCNMMATVCTTHFNIKHALRG